jgi:hypothetical protein
VFIVTNLRLLAGLLLSTAIWGQFPQEMGNWRPPSGETPMEPKSQCASLRSLTGYEFTIVTAEEQQTPAGTKFCRVIGQVQPEIRFEVALPARWNARLLMIGNGGYAGENIEAPGRMNVRNNAVGLGFAFTQTNTGHDAAQEPLGTFALSSQKLYDYAFRAVHVTAETAKRVAAAYYGTPPKRSYFQGCSTGGRQALISAQRFPNDFDGISAGAPVLDFTGTMLKYTSFLSALAKAPISNAKALLLADRVYAECDEKDGVKDGLIRDPRRCGFRPSEHLPKCADAEQPDCFTGAQISALELVYRDVSVNGERVFPGWAVGAEVAGGPGGRSGWDNWIFREQGPPISQLFAETFFRYVAYSKKDPNLQLTGVDLERDLPSLASIRKTLDATEPDLSAFRDRGGKLLMWFGWADAALNPLMGVEYYESVLRTMGSRTGDFFRLYMMPGVFHCAGGPGCDAFPRMAALIDWVEQGKTPQSLIASKIVSGNTIRTRPLCPYPQLAVYSGSGSTDDAANFRCAEPQ